MTDEKCSICKQAWSLHEFAVPAPYCPEPQKKHDFAVEPASGISICLYCGLSELAAKTLPCDPERDWGQK